MYRVFLISICTLLLCLTACQVEPLDYPRTKPVTVYHAEDYKDGYENLLAEYGYMKELPDGFELQTLLALQHYPELRNTRIKFIVKKAFIPLASRPALYSLLRKRNHRTYRVIISDQSLPQMENILLKNLPFNAQVAIIGHELAHAVEYETLNSHQLSAVGLLYFFGSFRASMEKGTDLRTIEHGLGWPLLDYAEYVREVSGSNQRQNDFMDKFYMNPDEIREAILRSELYQNVGR